jgi:hypothetical protein
MYYHFFSVYCLFDCISIDGVSAGYVHGVIQIEKRLREKKRKTLQVRIW